MTDLNTAVQRASDDLHNTAVSAQQALAAVTEAVKAITAQTNRLGTVLDALQSGAQEAVVVMRDADGKINAIKLPWFLK